VIVPAIGGIGQAVTGQLGTSQPAGVGQGASAGAGESALSGAVGTGPGNNFSGALTEAISSLEKTQQSGDSAAQALATGSVSDPESAVVTVQDAQMAMQLASQLRTKAVEAATSIFQTQV
jgi:flagellar hook-basal body complex protein FliE